MVQQELGAEAIFNVNTTLFERQHQYRCSAMEKFSAGIERGPSALPHVNGSSRGTAA